MNWRDHIVSDPQIVRGKPCIKGTRVPAALVLGYLASGRGNEVILREFPDLTPEDVAACQKLFEAAKRTDRVLSDQECHRLLKA